MRDIVVGSTVIGGRHRDSIKVMGRTGKSWQY